jgi:hypothetical protein
MMGWKPITLAALLAAAGCNQQQPQNNAGSPPPPPEAPAPPPAPTPPSPRPAPPAPHPAIDPTSVEAAVQVVEHYGALVEQGDWAEAEKLWGQSTTAREFTTDLKKNVREVHLEIGKPGDMEGAAGSIFVTVPVVFYGKDNDGKAFRHKADIIIRRVNDVPGSTEAQRRWHIDGIEGQDTGAD